jgi:uncharacterized protein YchJ
LCSPNWIAAIYDRRRDKRFAKEKTKVSIQKQRPKGVIRKGLPESLPISVQKSYFMLTEAERNVDACGCGSGKKYKHCSSKATL